MIAILLSLWSKIKAINWKKLIPYIIIAGLLIFGIIQTIGKRNLRETNARYEGNFIELNRQYQDKKGKWTMETSAKTVKINELQAMKDNGNKEVARLQSIITAMGIKLKNVESMGSSSFVIHDTILMPLYLQNSDTSAGEFHYTDGYFTMDLTTCEFGTKMVYNYQDTLTWAANTYFLEKWKFKNIFCWRDKYVKLNSQLANPKAKITAQEYYRLKSRRTKRIVE